MLYASTRNSGLKVSSAEAIVKGIADDGGLFVPTEIPKVSLEKISNLANKTYTQRAKEIMSLFLTDFSAEEIEKCVLSAYNANNFGSDEIAPLHTLGDAEILELWHGPTCAFKDMALQILPHLMTCSIKKCNIKKEIVILVATSGDTGKAALEGFADVEGTRILVFFPENGVSKIQKLQMLTQSGKNVGVASVYGNFDDAQTGVKRIFGDEEYNKKLDSEGFRLSSANSINWGRLLPQIVYYFSAYCDMVKKGRIKVGDKINICVPTGNFGNILASWYAGKMGLPVNKFICASNANNVLTDFINTGVYDKNRSFHTTSSPSMDILISSNLERLLSDITGDEKAVSGWMQELGKNGKYEISPETKKVVSERFFGGFCDDEATKASISKVWNEHKYLMDTHTAVAYNVYEQYVAETGDKTPTVIASTANPYKFNSAVYSSISPQAKIENMDEFDILDALNRKTGLEIPKSLSELKTKAVRFDTKCAKEDMINVVSGMLGIK
ncbi:MAG: threonine synthase [Ruminococcaceae bacterium]|nr:threonine synthase [Oscillospiraceae bacterium]